MDPVSLLIATVISFSSSFPLPAGLAVTHPDRNKVQLNINAAAAAVILFLMYLSLSLLFIYYRNRSPDPFPVNRNVVVLYLGRHLIPFCSASAVFLRV